MYLSIKMLDIQHLCVETLSRRTTDVENELCENREEEHIVLNNLLLNTQSTGIIFFLVYLTSKKFWRKLFKLQVIGAKKTFVWKDLRTPSPSIMLLPSR